MGDKWMCPRVFPLSVEGCQFTVYLSCQCTVRSIHYSGRGCKTFWKEPDTDQWVRESHFWPVTVIVPPPPLAVVSWCSRLTVFYIHWLDFFIYSRYDQVKDLTEEGGFLLQFMQIHRCRYCLQITMQLILIMSRNHGWLRECNMNVRKKNSAV